MIERDLQEPFRLPREARQIVLVRHGSADHRGNADSAADGFSGADPGLTDRGLEQASTVARRLADEYRDSLTTLFSSGLRRTDATAAPVAASLGLPVRPVHQLREVSLGHYEGAAFERARSSADPLFLRAFAEERWDVLTGAEPKDEFAGRVRAGLDLVADQTPPGQHALVFTHGGVVAEACHQATGSRPFAFIDVENASITVLVRAAGGTWHLGEIG